MQARQVLVFNAGSSSIRYALYDMARGQAVVSGAQEGIGTATARWAQTDHRHAGAAAAVSAAMPRGDHAAGFDAIIERVIAPEVERATTIDAVGHRVVHGGDAFRAPTRVDAAALRRLHEIDALAPLHNQRSLIGIEAIGRRFPQLPQVAVFDTAFHASLPPHVARYAVPREWYQRYGVRRYGFHGISHGHAMRAAAALLGKDVNDIHLITLHLGGGASIAAIRNGVCIDTSMGMTPLEGLVMGTRCGDVDPAIPAHVARQSGQSPDDIERIMNERSGLLGLCGTADMRELHRRADVGDGDAALARDMFCYRIRKYIGAYHAVLGRLDGVVFSGGIGENDALIRTRVCDGLDHLGIRLDDAKNSAPPSPARRIEHRDARVPVMVVQADEALEIARETRRCLAGAD